MKYTVDEIKKRIGASTLSPELAQEALEGFIEVLDMRVGDVIMDKLSEEQMVQFEQFKDDGSEDDKISEWLLTVAPDRDEIVDQEVDKLLAEIDELGKLPEGFEEEGESQPEAPAEGGSEPAPDPVPEATPEPEQSSPEEAPAPEQSPEVGESAPAEDNSEPAPKVAQEPEQPSDQPQEIPQQEPAPEAGPEPLPQEGHQHE